MIEKLVCGRYLKLYGKVIDIEVVNNNDLKRITGGISALGMIGIAALIIFISGVIEGITNPGRCDNRC